jgi:hypothetical protein
MNTKSKTPPKEPNPPAAQERKWTPTELEDYLRKRHYKLHSPVQFQLPGIYIPERSDAQILDFLGLVVTENEPALRKLADAAVSNDGCGGAWAISMAEAIMAAKAVARRATYYGLRAAPDVADEKEGRGREPILLELQGISGLTAFGDTRLLYDIASVLYHFREEIRLQVQSNLVGEHEVRMAEAMALAEAIEDRGASLDEVEEAETKGIRTPLLQHAWTFKAIQAIQNPSGRK